MEDRHKRIIYIDNLRIILIILVIIAHAAITYGPIGFWYYYERYGYISTYLLAFFVSLMQSFLIGLFFLISAFFIPFSLKNKGPGEFLIDRLKRLGIPLLFYIFLISPFIRYLEILIIKDKYKGFLSFYYEDVLKSGVIDVGPLWFLQVLLIFSILYVMFHGISTGLDKKYPVMKLPSDRNIFLAVVTLAFITFITRIKFPVSSSTLNLNFGLAPQYIFLFCVGILASENQWLRAISLKKATFWSKVTLIAMMFWPVFGFLKVSGSTIEMFMGGLSWQSLLYASWEAVLSISIPISMVFIFRQKFDYQNNFFRAVSKSSYSVYIIHSIVIILISYSLREVDYHPLVKFIIVATAGIILCYAISFFITKIRFLKKIL